MSITITKNDGDNDTDTNVEVNPHDRLVVNVDLPEDATEREAIPRG